jgi:hypothetical protein
LVQIRGENPCGNQRKESQTSRDTTQAINGALSTKEYDIAAQLKHRAELARVCASFEQIYPLPVRLWVVRTAINASYRRLIKRKVKSLQ